MPFDNNFVKKFISIKNEKSNIITFLLSLLINSCLQDDAGSAPIIEVAQMRYVQLINQGLLNLMNYGKKNVFTFLIIKL